MIDAQSASLALWLWTQQTEVVVALLKDEIDASSGVAGLAGQSIAATAQASTIDCLSVLVLGDLKSKLDSFLAEALASLLIDVDWPLVLKLLHEEYDRVRESTAYQQN